MTIKYLQERLIAAAEELIQAKNELTEIDSKFGDADHGVTMEKVAKTIIATVNGSTTHSSKELLDTIGTAIMLLNGGSAVPLWATYITGLSINAPDCDIINAQQLKIMLQTALDELCDITTAKVGEKTMMDTIIPATYAATSCDGDTNAVLAAAFVAAQNGAMATKEMISKFGRAKSYKEQTLGTPDAGAMSAMYFYKGLNK